jgi:hypothetical protein
MAPKASTSTAFASAADLLTVSDMWAMYIQGLSQASGLANPSQLMLAGTSMPAQLNTETLSSPPVSKEEALWQIYSLANVMPAWGTAEEAGKTSNVGLFYARSESTYFSQYSSFIRSIKLRGNPDPAYAAAVRIAQAEYDQASEEWQKTYNGAFAAFQAAPTGMYPTWDDFLKKTPWGKRLQQADAKMDAAQMKLDQAMRAAYGPQFDQLALAIGLVRDVQKQLADGKGQLVMEVENDAGKFPVAQFSPSLLGLGGGAGFSAWLDQAIAAVAGGLPPEVKITVDQGAGRYSYSQLTFAANGNVRYFPFVWFEANGKYTEVAIDTAASEFGIEISVQSVTQVSITPGQWYMGDFVRNFSQPDDFLAGSPFHDKAIWGPNGLFNTQVNGLVVAYRPSVTARFNAESYQRLKQDWSASASLRIGVGPFYLGIGGGASGSKDDIHWDDQAHSFSFTDKTLIPKIIGLLVNTPHYPPGT